MKTEGHFLNWGLNLCTILFVMRITQVLCSPLVHTFKLSKKSSGPLNAYQMATLFL